MIIHPSQRLWIKHAHMPGVENLANELLSLRSGKLWLELLSEHHYLLGSQLVFHPLTHRISFRSEYTQAEILSALLGIKDHFRTEHPIFELITELELDQIVLGSCTAEPCERIFNWVHQCSLLAVEISAGACVIGTPQDKPKEPLDWEQREIVMEHSFAIMKYPVTQLLYQQVSGKNASLKMNPTHPVTMVDWFEAILFCNRLSQLQGLKPVYDVQGEDVSIDPKADGWRLPTEAQWEYAAQAGDILEFAGSDNWREVGWFPENANQTTHSVGQQKPNQWGIYDMSGNVCEWCWNWTDDSMKTSKSYRGGSWFLSCEDGRVWTRDGQKPSYKGIDIGFRCVRILTDVSS